LNERSILVTGCSSGIGYACAKGLKARGYRVIATARSPEDIARLSDEGLDCLELDYRHAESVAACAEATARLTGGKLYALFNNGAYGQPGAVEDIRRDVLEEIFAANVFGWHDLTRRCLPMIRANGGGRVINTSSVLGLVSLRWRGAYCATKFAVEALTDALRRELAGSEIRAILIEPGPIASRFVEHALAAFDRNVDERGSPYRAFYAAQRERLNKGGSSRFKLPPEAVFAKLVLALESPVPKARYYVTVPTYLAAFGRRLLPPRFFDRILNKVFD
jgi:NAD(P)-dependent dehydrogenase (short-subunit alcohol dehydrogenase family)